MNSNSKNIDKISVQKNRRFAHKEVLNHYDNSLWPLGLRQDGSCSCSLVVTDVFPRQSQDGECTMWPPEI